MDAHVVTPQVVTHGTGKPAVQRFGRGFFEPKPGPEPDGGSSRYGATRRRSEEASMEAKRLRRPGRLTITAGAALIALGVISFNAWANIWF
jgi:hypothetical protein